MKIGIKYCGGCNPRYDRTSLLSKLKNEVGHIHQFETASSEVIYDMILVLCGCTSGCADHSMLQARKEKIIVTGEEDYNILLSKIS
jgi:4-hydroxybutyrate CoA-transferase